MKIFFLILFIIVLVGIYYVLLVPKFKRSYRTRMVSNGVLSEFRKIGFTDEKVLVRGIYKEYFTVLTVNWADHFSRKSILISLEFEPIDETKEELKKMNELLRSKYNKKYTWFLNEMKFLIHYNIKCPNFEKIIQEIENMSTILKNENLLPISEIESEKLQSKYAYWQYSNI